MRITNIKYGKYNLPLPSSLKTSNQTFTEKQIIIIKATDEKGKNHFGEVGPLPGFSSESIDECELAINKILPNIDNEENLGESIADLIDLPSLKFALEQILISIESPSKKLPDGSAVKMNFMIGLEDIAIIMKRIEYALNKGFDTLKLKIGREDFDEDLNIIKRINNEFGGGLKLRLDNNGSWDLEEAMLNFDKLGNYNIEYVEQPVSDTENLQRLIEISEISVAPDESLQSLSVANDFLNNERIEFLVLKPSLRLGIYDTVDLIEKASEYGKKIIVTSGMETDIGRSTLLYLAALTDHKFAHGLSIPTLGKEYFSSPIDFEKPLITLSEEILNVKELIEL